MNPDTFAVVRQPGPAWQSDRGLREQADWDRHAAFMNNLAAQGIVIMGGSLANGNDILLIMAAENKQEVQQISSGDPWSQTGLLVVPSMQAWTLLLDSRKG